VRKKATSTAGFISQSGGLVWHSRAWRYRHNLWIPFTSALDHWLSCWQPPERNLLILGSSAGWTLSAPFCARFDQIVCVDLDPLAPWLFRLIHRHPHLTFYKADVIHDLQPIIRSYPDHAILFSNVVGQYGFHCTDPSEAEHHIACIKHQLIGRSWASYHDRLSLHRETGAPSPAPVKLDHILDAPDLARHLDLTGPCFDHLTYSLLPDGPCMLMAWDIMPKRRHWIEAGRVNKDGLPF
jgi:hypothetical protein